jgi:hypothetical protein
VSFITCDLLQVSMPSGSAFRPGKVWLKRYTPRATARGAGNMVVRRWSFVRPKTTDQRPSNVVDISGKHQRFASALRILHRKE